MRILFPHQGWTDIIGCLALIDFYKDQIDAVWVRYDAIPMLKYYLRDKGITILSLEIAEIQSPPITGNTIFGIGAHDEYRKDVYRYKWIRMVNNHTFFGRAFYEAYDIPYEIRYTNFELHRQPEKEKALLEKVDPPQNYILKHDTKENPIEVAVPANHTLIQLGNLTQEFFDAYRLLEGAKHIYAIDSVWGVLLYLLHMRYGINRNVTIHCPRGYRDFFNPIPDGWTIN